MKNYFDAEKVSELTKVVFDFQEVDVRLVKIIKADKVSFIYQSLQTKRFLLQKDARIEELELDDYNSTEEAIEQIDCESTEIQELHEWQRDECWKNFAKVENEINSKWMDNYLENFAKKMSDFEDMY